jgi:predicted DNA-binding transcriptional regulator AlpA
MTSTYRNLRGQSSIHPPGAPPPREPAPVHGLTASPEARLLLSAADAAKFIGIGRSLFFELRAAGRIPAPVMISRGLIRRTRANGEHPRTRPSPYWTRATLEAWVAAGCPAVDPGPEAAANTRPQSASVSSDPPAGEGQS